MISTYLAVQNAVLARNTASARMVRNANQMLSMVSFGNSQPLKPSFAAAADMLELQTKADETEITVYNKMQDALEKALAKRIERSAPKFGGLNCIA